ncbi:MAG: HEAT repeat domain-containing protein, partial [Acidimicrobiales bacterium]
ALSDPSREVRIEALGVLITLPDLGRVEEVGRLTRDPDPEVRHLAVQVLAAADDVRSIPFLLEAARDPVETVRGVAHAAVLERQSPSLVQLLVRSLETPPLRQVAAELLAKMAGQSTGLLVAALQEAGPEARQAIIGVLDSTKATRVMSAGLDDRQAERRLEALEGLSVLHSGAAVSSVLRVLNDPDPRVRRRAAILLGELGERGVEGQLRRTLGTDPDLTVVEAAEAALRRLAEQPPAGPDQQGSSPGRQL